MTYHNSVKFIKNSPSELQSKTPFGRIKILCNALGNPEKHFRYLRLAGSNGKTVCAEMLMSILKQANITAGCLYMPLRDDIRENIRIGAEDLSIEDTALYISKIYEAVNTIRRSDPENAELSAFTPTKSEILLALSLLIFKDKHCSLCIIEGDHNGDDPSKFLPSPFATMICGTIPSGDRHEITRIRSYITRGIQEIISAPQDREAFGVISATCASVNCRLTIPSKASMIIRSCTLGGTSFSYKGLDYSIKLCGKFQIANVEVVLETVEMLTRRGYKISYENIKKGLEALSLKSKFEILSLRPAIIADSTHTPIAIGTVCDSLLDFQNLIGSRICLCLPEGKIIDNYTSELDKRGYEIQKIFTLSEEKNKDSDIIKHFPTAKAMTREALAFLEPDMTLLISGQYNFTDKIRHEILDKMGF